ncbi:MAG: hypothetical protein S0880_18130 [Actinomycetota bacterium]|nr:hypothetical protein [Actinomycetota bacterium]
MDVHGGRILLVTPADTGEFAASTLEKLDHPVTTCHGPSPGEPCPMLRDGDCPMFDEAHGIVFGLDLGRPEHRAILGEYEAHVRRSGREVPLRVVTATPATEELKELFADAIVWDHDPSVAELDGFAASVEAADR